MTASNAAVEKQIEDKKAEKAGSNKVPDKVAEKRRALGRGLESLLPGPRPIATVPKSSLPAVSTTPETGGQEGAAIASPRGSATIPVPTTPVSGADTVPKMTGHLDLVQAAASEHTPDRDAVFLLNIDEIDLNPYQTRRDFNEEALKELSESIEAQGVLQPIVVRPGSQDGRFILILGERRLRASILLGKTTIPAITKTVSAQQAAEMTLVENVQRRDLDCVEQAEAFATLSTQFKLTQEQIGKRVGLSREQVSNYMRLLSLPEGVILALQHGTLTYSHARTLLRLKDNVQIWKMAQKVIAEKISVAKLEDMVFGSTSSISTGQGKPDGGARWVDPNVKAAQRILETSLGMRVQIRDRKGRGKILIEYSTLEDFDRLVSILKGR